MHHWMKMACKEQKNINWLRIYKPCELEDCFRNKLILANTLYKPNEYICVMDEFVKRTLLRYLCTKNKETSKKGGYYDDVEIVD